jgi:hypothetical protein
MFSPAGLRPGVSVVGTPGLSGVHGGGVGRYFFVIINARMAALQQPFVVIPFFGGLAIQNR